MLIFHAGIYLCGTQTYIHLIFFFDFKINISNKNHLTVRLLCNDCTGVKCKSRAGVTLLHMNYKNLN